MAFGPFGGYVWIITMVLIMGYMFLPINLSSLCIFIIFLITGYIFLWSLSSLILKKILCDLALVGPSWKWCVLLTRLCLGISFIPPLSWEFYIFIFGFMLVSSYWDHSKIARGLLAVEMWMAFTLPFTLMLQGEARRRCVGCTFDLM